MTQLLRPRGQPFEKPQAALRATSEARAPNTPSRPPAGRTAITRAAEPHPCAGPPHITLTLLFLLCWLPGCGRPSTLSPNPETRPASAAPQNLTRADFVGSTACSTCHPAIYDRWSHSPMHRMTRRMAEGVSQAPFDGAEFKMQADVARMVTQNGQRYMHIRSAKYPSAWYRITKVIGGRFREDYAGVRVSGPRAEARTSGDERVLPVSYLLFEKEWRYKGYSVLSPERDGLRRGLKWKTSCIFCHNTAPWLSLHYDELYGVGAPSYQGAASLKLPTDKQLSYRVSDEAAFEQALDAESVFLGGDGISGEDHHERLEQAADETRRRFSEEHLIEVGIGCEACHGGSKEHALHPATVLPSYLPQSSFFSTTLQSGQPVPKALAMSHSCAKCHTVLFSRYEHTWEGGTRGFSPGGSNMNSGEARNFLLGRCTTQLMCTSCHDPHAEDSASSLARFDTVAGNGVCTQCHSELENEQALSHHTKHAPASTGSACLACHMPRKNIGLDYQLTRYHRIGSPTDPERVEQDRPLECALCHSDKSVGKLVSEMERLWNKRYDRTKLRALYGKDLEANSVTLTLSRGKAHEQAVAIHTSGTARQHENLALLVEQMDHEYPLLRFFARDAIERITGKRLVLDMHADGAALKGATSRQLRALAANPTPPDSSDRAPKARSPGEVEPRTVPETTPHATD